MSVQDAKPKISIVQGLRAVASIMVVFHHVIRAFTANAPASWLHPALVGSPLFYNTLAVGVDLFFVISGFIIVLASGRYLKGTGTAFEFLLRRVIRIYPAYLVITLGLIVAMVAKLLFYHRMNFDLSLTRLFGALTLFPTFDQNNEVHPILGVGWTLTYEMYFYFLFALSFSIARRSFFLPMLTGLLSSIFIAHFNSPNSALVKFLSNPILIEFAFGCFVALLSGISLSAVSAIALGLFGLSSFVLFNCLTVMTVENRFIGWGLPAALVVWSLIALEKSRYLKCPRMLAFLGDASYSIYLVHVPLIYFVALPLISQLNVAQISTWVSLFAVCLLVMFSISAGVAYFLLVESRIECYFKRLRRLPLM